MIAKANIRGWKWRFTKAQTFQMPFTHDGDPLTMQSDSGRTLVTLGGDKMIIQRHYHFDGATWAPDFKNVLPAAAVHDALLQLCDKYPDQLTEDKAHAAFKSQMVRDNFKLNLLYNYAVTSWPRKLYKLFTR